jgi:hypothetical protein
MLSSTILQLLEENIQNMQSSVYSNFLPEELGNQFDRIANKFVDDMIKPYPIGSLKGADEIQANMDDIKFLVAPSQATPTLNNGDYIMSLPSDYRNLLRDKVSVDVCGNGTSSWKPTYLTGFEDWESIKLNPFLRPKSDRVRSTLRGNQYVANAGGAVISLVDIVYIRKITPIDFTAPVDYLEFPDQTILKLIDLTRNRILEVVQSERLPSATQEINNFGTLT